MARTQTVTILFCDLVSSTERRARLGDDAADEFIQRFMAALREAVARHDGTEAKDLGDGLMAAFPASAADAVSCASDMHRAMPALDPNYPPQLRIGISAGEVAEKGNDWSGLAVVEAARLQAAAAPGQTLASAVVRSLVGTRRALRFRDVGSLSLKGLPAELATVEVVEEGTDVVDLSGASAPPVVPAQPAPPAGRRRGPFIAVAVIVVIALIAAGVGFALSRSSSNKSAGAGVVAPTGYTPRFESATCPSAVQTATPDATCGHLVVPQDRAQPQGKSVSLLVIREPAEVTGGAAAAVPTIDIGGHDSVQSSPVRSHSDLIEIGDRGFGEGNSPTLSCPEVGTVFEATLAHRTGTAADDAASTAAIGKCYRRLVASGVNPADYTLAASIRDVLDLVYALKLQRVDLLSGEAETAVAFGVLQAAPAAVRSITLEDPFPPGQGFLTDPTGDLAAAFTAYVGLCTANATCAKAYPNLEAAYESAHNQLAAHPPTVTAQCLCSASLPAIPVMVDGYRLSDALIDAFENSLNLPLIPAALTPDPEPTVIAPYVRDYLQSGSIPSEIGGNLSFFCSYYVHIEDTAASALSQRTYPQFVGTYAKIPWSQWCAQWKMPDVSAQLSQPVNSSVPVLLIRGDIAPIGNSQWITQLTHGLSNATVAEFPSLGGNLLSTGPGCLNTMRQQFLTNPNVKLDVDACTRQSPPIQFQAPPDG